MQVEDATIERCHDMERILFTSHEKHYQRCVDLRSI